MHVVHVCVHVVQRVCFFVYKTVVFGSFVSVLIEQ